MCFAGPVLSVALLVVGIGGSSSEVESTCFDHTNLVLKNTELKGHVYGLFNTTSLIECVTLCLASAKCLSFNFDLFSGTCELNSAFSSSFLAFDVNKIFSNATLWPKSLLGQCEGLCSKRCHVDKLGRTSCEEDYRSCPAPFPMANTSVTQTGLYPGATATFLCDDDEEYICGQRAYQITCLDTGVWEEVPGICGPKEIFWKGSKTAYFSGRLPCLNKDAFTFSVKGTMKHRKSRISLYVLQYSFTCFHGSIRPFRKTVVYNTKRNKRWEKQITKRVPDMPIVYGKEFHILVTYNTGSYWITLNKDFKVEFPDRANTVKVTKVKVRDTYIHEVKVTWDHHVTMS